MGNRNSNTARSMAQCVLTTVEKHCSSADPQCPVKGHLSEVAFDANLDDPERTGERHMAQLCTALPHRHEHDPCRL
jgi:hypothetical protein